MEELKEYFVCPYCHHKGLYDSYGKSDVCENCGEVFIKGDRTGEI